MKDIRHMNLAELANELCDLHEGDTVGRLLIADRMDKIHDLTRWIPVSERMPTDNGYYRIWDISEAQALFKDGEWIGERCIPSDSPYLKSKFREKLTPTHWQRITPPEGV